MRTRTHTHTHLDVVGLEPGIVLNGVIPALKIEAVGGAVVVKHGDTQDVRLLCVCV